MKNCYFCMSEVEMNNGICPICGADENAEIPIHHLVPGYMLENRYMVGRSIGEGGFGITYIGLDTKLDMKVAIKEYYPNGYANRVEGTTVQRNTFTDAKAFFEVWKEKFILEAKTLAKFSNEPGIVSVHDFFEDNNTAYIVMEFVEGETLKSVLMRNQHFDAEELIGRLGPLMVSLNKIHKQGLIHRDISPDNIMITANGPKLLDFGAARQVTSEANKSLSVMLKVGYTPEEQYRQHGEQGPWTDIYALCATIYRCITGIIPDDAMERMYKDELKTISELGIQIPENYEYAIMSGLALRKENRLQNIDEFFAALNGEKFDRCSVKVAVAQSAETVLPVAETVSPVVENVSQTVENASQTVKTVSQAVETSSQKVNNVTQTIESYSQEVVQNRSVVKEETVAMADIMSENETTVKKEAVIEDKPPVEIAKPVTEDKPPVATTKPKKKKTGMIIGIVAGAVVLIAVAVIIIVNMAGSRQPERNHFSGFSYELSDIDDSDASDSSGFTNVEISDDAITDNNVDTSDDAITDSNIDTSDDSETVVDNERILYNYDMEEHDGDVDELGTWASSPAEASANVYSGYMNLHVYNFGENEWEIGFSTRDFELKKGKTYLVTFKIKSNNDNEDMVYHYAISQDYGDYFKYYDNTKKFSLDWEEVRIEYRPNEADENCNFIIYFGGYGVRENSNYEYIDVMVDDVVIKELD